MTPRTLSSIASALLATMLLVGGTAACSDDADTDEKEQEIDEVEQDVDEELDEVEQEVDEVEDEIREEAP